MLGEGGISGRELAMQGMLDHFAQFLVGQDPRRIEHIWQTCYRGAYFEGGKILAATISAIDIALWDILGQVARGAGLPVARRRLPQDVPLLRHARASLTGPECVERTKELVEAGWRSSASALEWPATDWTGRWRDLRAGGVGRPGRALDKEMRKAVGPDVELSIDFHHRLSVVEAALFCQRIADRQPLLPGGADPLPRTRRPTGNCGRMTPIPFAIGEEFSSKWAFAPYVEEGILNFARIDVSNVGGLTEARKVAGMVRGALHRHHAPQPARPDHDRGLDPPRIATSNFAHLEYRTDIAEDYPADLFPVVPELDGDSLPAADRARPGRRVQRGRRQGPRLRVLGGAALAAPGWELYELVGGVFTP